MRNRQISHFSFSRLLLSGIALTVVLQKALAEEDHTMFEMPDLASMIKIAVEEGDIEAVTGQRHYSGAPVIEWSTQYSETDDISVYHAYGFGGSGLTLAPAVAEHLSTRVGKLAIDIDNESGHPPEVIILGAGYIGIYAALELRHYLNHHNKSHISIKVIANAYPRGISTIKESFREPAQEDNYSSKAAGGWVMPVSVEPLNDKVLWCSLVRRSQQLWHKYASTPPLNNAIHMTRSLVFYEDVLEEKSPRVDKSGIRTVNSICPFNLYPEQPSDFSFYGRPLTSDTNFSTSSPLQFGEVILFNNVVQADTVSVLLYTIQQLIRTGVRLIQTQKPIDSFAKLQSHLKTNRRSIIINASGNGAHDVFPDAKASQPIRGDLVILKLPLSRLTDEIRAASKFSFWAKGSYYAFLRYSMDKMWMEIVLGGSFIKDDNDLRVRTETIRDIVTFWLNFFHFGANPQASHYMVEEKEELILKVMEKLKLPDQSDQI